MEAIIKLENVNFYYDKGKPTEVHALKDVNLEIKAGEYISFFGPSGCGKSTLLYIIAGVERPDSGKVIVNGQDLMKFSSRELAIYRQIGIGIIFQNFNLIPSIKNFDNVTLPMAFLGISPKKREQRASEIMARLGVAELMDRYPFELSGGQQQRVSIARSLANNPPVILADEPIGNLDSVNANNVLDILKEFNQRDGKSIIMVTHEAWSLKDVNKIFYMRDGAITKIEEKGEKMAVKKVGAGYYHKNLFPELPVIEARAKVMASLILRGYSQEEIKRLEYFLSHYLRNQIDKETFRMVLDRPYKEGGVGLWKQRAKKIADYMENIIKEEKELEVLYKKLERDPETPLYEEVEKIQRWLLGDFTMKITPLQARRLNEIVMERIRNIILPEHFQKILNLPKDEGGVGLKIRTSLKITEKLETLLGREGGIEAITKTANA
ncbi:MAG: ABC transporter ATP-binding protein [Candidatus Terrybacteria bacterium]|nr:ABC transporter ATP-binding protein [Candidatus Terrybacteria bacterium]